MELRNLSLFVQGLGELYGYGAVIQEATEIWGKDLAAKGMTGAEFAIGPCKALTVPCGCDRYDCVWCNGCGWLTPHVKTIKDATTGSGQE
jgi:hypothetical protein